MYSLNWFNFPVEAQKKVQMIVMRSQKPLVLDAAGMGLVSLPAFLTVTYLIFLSLLFFLCFLNVTNGRCVSGVKFCIFVFYAFIEF